MILGLKLDFAWTPTHPVPLLLKLKITEDDDYVPIEINESLTPDDILEIGNTLIDEAFDPDTLDLTRKIDPGFTSFDHADRAPGVTDQQLDNYDRRIRNNLPSSLRVVTFDRVAKLLQWSMPEQGDDQLIPAQHRVQVLPPSAVVRGGHAADALSPRSQARLLRSGQDHREQHQQRSVQRSLEARHHCALPMQTRHSRLHLARLTIEYQCTDREQQQGRQTSKTLNVMLHSTQQHTSRHNNGVTPHVSSHQRQRRRTARNASSRAKG